MLPPITINSRKCYLTYFYRTITWALKTTMNRLKLALNPDVTKFIKENYPVIRKRTALWFFSNELKNNLTNHEPLTEVEKCTRELKSTSLDKTPAMKIRHTKILNMWKKMDPESKRKYFNMAEFDELRYKEQKSQWISEVSSILLGHHASLESVSEAAPTHDELQKNFLASLNKLHNSYEQMIQLESTKQLYKDAIKKADRYECNLSQEEILSAIPKSQWSILARPRRPPCAFILYVRDNVKRLTEARRLSNYSGTIMQLGASEWATLDINIKLDYERKYESLKNDYDKAMEEFKIANIKANDTYLQQATKEKKAFRKSLRKRLRDSSVLPLSIRNAFNFFLMDNKDIPMTELTEIWRNLPNEKKMKYLKMHHYDVIRYQNEREVYNELTKALNDIINKRKSRNSKDSKEVDDDS